MESIKISLKEYEELKAKAQKWEDFCAKQAKHLNSGTPEERAEKARRAVEARWSKVRQNQTKE